MVATNRTTLELKRMSDRAIIEAVNTTNRTTLELKHTSGIRKVS